MRTLPIAALAILAAGCATVAPVQLTRSFDPSEVAWSKGDGPNAVRGSAVLRTVGGDAKTCAGLEAFLIPVSSYADERMMTVYGNTTGGYRPVTANLSFTSTDPTYLSTTRATRCDAEGRFTFSRVPSGDYYVMSYVVWGVPLGGYMTSRQGGALMQRVTLKDGQTEEVVLTAS